ncbi:MAG TPA: hypothetical protein VFN13_03890 [Rudaea sp.]|nr:hypothetical protein [Rudaea sp.]
MRSITILVLARSGCALLLGFAGVTAGCGSTDVLYTRDHSPVALPPRVGHYENPDNYRVDPSAYPRYAAKYNFAPPKPREGTWTAKVTNTEILVTDIWHVTHKVGDRLIAFSDAYQKRQCDWILTFGKLAGAFKEPFGGPCIANYLYSLYVFPDGRIDGWMLLDNPGRVALSKDRYTVMDPALREGPGWPEQPLFEALH